MAMPGLIVQEVRFRHSWAMLHTYTARNSEVAKDLSNMFRRKLTPHLSLHANGVHPS